MDLYCRHCGEPWYLDSLHDRVDDLHNFTDDNRPRGTAYDKLYRAVAADFRDRGCPAFGSKCSVSIPDPNPNDGELTIADKAGILYDLLGDDVDGAAAMLDDFR